MDLGRFYWGCLGMGDPISRHGQRQPIWITLTGKR